MTLRIKGFTLIELLIVISTILILVSIMSPMLKKAKGKAKITQAKTDIQNISLAIKAYETAFDDYPANLNLLLTTKGGGPFIEKIPTDPWHNSYQYRTPGVHKPYSFDLYSYGPDKTGGTSDDITNW